jgi:circadian clock protein KaiB
MPTKRNRNSTFTERYERALKRRNRENYVLRLYVAGATPASQRAIESIKTLCEQHLKGRYQLDVVDVYQQPELAQGVQLVAMPTLVKVMPSPLRRFIGDMSRTERLVLGLRAA